MCVLSIHTGALPNIYGCNASVPPSASHLGVPSGRARSGASAPQGCSWRERELWGLCGLCECRTTDAHMPEAWENALGLEWWRNAVGGGVCGIATNLDKHR
eukprot:TRINITY_DN33987_c0_g1_i1.p3 TRINITY_DN33987_c0_g1~~TRINITY_DN33987_c0_g1_i1.p3  ORF type:complete len:101 (+),score=1.05 TRINITY_DN33987_c0_g1_i1:536-838(+)